jgi:hypothetical protein
MRSKRVRSMCQPRRYDKQWPCSKLVAPVVPSIPVAQVTGVAAAIETAGSLSHFSFDVAKGGSYVVETLGTTDLIMKLFGPDSDTRVLAEDDDSGAGSNPRIEADLVPGKYVVQLRHYDPKGTGPYTIRVYG